MVGVTYDKALRKWRVRAGKEEGYIRVGAYDTEKEAQEALLKYLEDGLLPVQKWRGTGWKIS